jgi:hypothetical protein
LNACSFLASSPAIAQQAGAWRHQYRHQGMTISLADALDRRHGHGLQARLVTGTINHYPVPELDTVALPRTVGQN